MEFINNALLIISISLFFSLSAAEADCIPVTSPSPGPMDWFPLLGPIASSPSLSPSPSPSLPPCASSASSSEAPPSALPVVDPAIHNVCSKTSYVRLCLSSIAPYLGAKTDVMSVLAMEIKASRDASQHALDAISAMVADHSTPSSASSILGVCKENYESSVQDYDDALKAIPSGDFGSLMSHLSAVYSDLETCEDSFAEASYGQPTPTRKFYDPLTKLASNCLAIARFIHK